MEEIQVVAPALALAAAAAADAGDDPDAGRALAAEFETVTRGKAAMYRSESVASSDARIALASGARRGRRDWLIARSKP